MADAARFNRGDAVVHPRRPEWGEGVVDQATTIYHDGKSAQRLVVRFAHRGTVTINTGVAPLVSKSLSSKDDDTVMSATGTSSFSSRFSASGTGAGTDAAGATKGGGWLGSLGQKPGDELYRLPDAMTDPFASLGKRLEATLDSYRFSSDARNPRTLLDWAIGQTGLNDPLSKYTRHELEQAFPRFVRDRDNHLQELVRLIKRQSKTELLGEAMRNSRVQAAKDALQRVVQRS